MKLISILCLMAGANAARLTVTQVDAANVQSKALEPCHASIFWGFCSEHDLAGGGVACVASVDEAVTRGEQVQCVPKYKTPYSCPSHLSVMCDPAHLFSASCPSLGGFCSESDLAGGGVACIGSSNAVITKAHQVQCVPTRNMHHGYYGCPPHLPVQCNPSFSSALIEQGQSIWPFSHQRQKQSNDEVAKFEACHASIFWGFCSEHDLAGGGVACVASTDEVITRGEQVQCVPKRKMPYSCPSHLPVMCGPSLSSPSCPSSIFDGFCSRSDLAGGGVACIGSANAVITQAHQVQCVPVGNTRNGYYGCPPHLPVKCSP